MHAKHRKAPPNAQTWASFSVAEVHGSALSRHLQFDARHWVVVFNGDRAGRQDISAAVGRHRSQPTIVPIDTVNEEGRPRLGLTEASPLQLQQGPDGEDCGVGRQ